MPAKITVDYVTTLPLKPFSPKVIIDDEGENNKYEVIFHDWKKEEVVCKKSFQGSGVAYGERQWFTNWEVEIIKNGESEHIETFDLSDKVAFIKIDASALGDNLAWMPYIEEFRKKHGCQVICSTFWNWLFENEYKYILFVVPNTQIKNVYYQIYVGTQKPDNVYYAPLPYGKEPLQKTACDILGLEHKEIKPKITIPKFIPNERYVTNQDEYKISGEIGKLKKLKSVIDNYQLEIKTIFDLGARDLRESIWFSKVYPSSMVHAFECNPDMIQLIKSTYTYPGVIFNSLAINSYNGACEFHKVNQEKTKTKNGLPDYIKRDGNPGASSLYKSTGSIYENDVIKVDCMRLDRYMEANELRSIDLLWMDIQGAELTALQSLGNKISDVKIIHTEITRGQPEYEGQAMFDDVNNFLTDNGFVLHSVDAIDAIYINKKFIPQNQKVVCISERASHNKKEWPGNWQQIVDFLVSQGYAVKVISKEPTKLKNVIDKTGNLPLQDRMLDLQNCEFFIGVSSGLAWLSWAIGTHVFLISDYTPPDHEFNEGCTRIYSDKCRREIVDEYMFWGITEAQVIEAIKNHLKASC